jgi:hypothetical protein
MSRSYIICKCLSVNLTCEQFQKIPGDANTKQARSLTQYHTGLRQQQTNQMPGRGGIQAASGPANQGWPMMSQVQDTGAIIGYYNAGEMANGLQAPGLRDAQPGGNHTLQEYELMLLEQQNERLMIACLEQDTMATVPGGRDGTAPGAIGLNGQPFQGTSPQGTRSVNLSNPADQMKRVTSHTELAGMPSSLLPEGQSRGSPSSMNFNMPDGPMDPSMTAPYINPNTPAGIQNNMRPPSSYKRFTKKLTPQQMAIARQQNPNANGQSGQSARIIPGANQGAPQQNMASPGMPQRQMPPPAALAAALTTDGRARGSPRQGAALLTPQKANKPNPRKKNNTKDTKAKVSLFH